MKKARFNYWKLTAVVAVLAITIIAGVRPSTATKQPPMPAAAVPGADLANEERAVARYFDDLVTYDTQTAQLSAKAKLVSADLDPLQRQSDDLKGRLSGLQNTIREIVTKLKAANEWNDLDATTAARITDASKRSYFQELSFKLELEESSNGLGGHANEISTPLDNLRKKLASRYGDGADVHIVRAAYEAPRPPFAFYSVKCSIGIIRIGLIERLGGTPGKQLLHDQFAACHAPGEFNPM